MSSTLHCICMNGTFQVPAHLRGTSAAGMTPVVDSWSGRGRKPVMTPSRPAITQQIQVIEAADWTFFNTVHARSNKTSSSASYSAHDFTFPVIPRLLYEGEFQPGVPSEWGSTPESTTPPFISLLPDSVSVARIKMGFLDLPVFSCRVKLNDDAY